MTPPTVFIGLDTETTGLHADADILELGMIAYAADLDEIATFSSLILPDDLHAAYRAAMDQARQMHHTSGLWDELTDAVADDRADELRVDRVEHAAIRWVRAHTGDGPVFLLGSTIGYDRGVLARHMPGLLACFHHQSVDATSIHLIARHLYGTPQADTAHHSAHRCLSDIRDSAALITRSTAAIIATQCPGTHPAPTADMAQV